MSAAGPRYLEFFAGCGLVRAGLSPSWRCVWANDNSPSKSTIYRDNFGDREFFEGDVAEVDARELPEAEMAWASFPCQDLSLAGWRRGMAAPRSGTFWAFWRLMRDLFDASRRPPLIVLENVTGLLYGRDFAGLCEALAGIGLRFGALVLDARWFLPQSRPRVFVVACDRRIPVADVTSVAPAGEPWFSSALARARTSLPAGVDESWLWWRLPAVEGRPPTIESLIERDPVDARWRSAVEVDRLIGMMSAVNRLRIEEKRALSGRSIGFLYRRMRDGRQRPEVRFDGLAGCLRTPSGGSSRQTVVSIEGGRVRMRLLTSREAAALMGAPQGFRLPANYNAAYRAMGDGVAVPVVRWLSRNLLEELAEAARPPAPPVKSAASEFADAPI